MISPSETYIVKVFHNGAEEWKPYGSNQTHMVVYNTGDQVWFRDDQVIGIRTHNGLLMGLNKDGTWDSRMEDSE